jgi:Sugar-specific transcriptional regulator TrmB.
VTQQVLISAIYTSENVVRAVSRSAVDTLILIGDRKGASTEVDQSIEKVRDKFAGIEISVIRESPYDMEQIASRVADVIDKFEDADISVNLTPGRKTQSFAQMFAAYSRPSKVDELFYQREEGGRTQVPSLSIDMNENELQALRGVVDGESTTQELHSALDVSQPMVYSYVNSLRDSGYMEGDNQNLNATGAGRLISLLLQTD